MACPMALVGWRKMWLCQVIAVALHEGIGRSSAPGSGLSRYPISAERLFICSSE